MLGADFGGFRLPPLVAAKADADLAFTITPASLRRGPGDLALPPPLSGWIGWLLEQVHDVGETLALYLLVILVEEEF